MLKIDIETMYLKESYTTESFFTQIIELVSQMRSHGETLEQKRVVETTLRILPPRFESIVLAI